MMFQYSLAFYYSYYTLFLLFSHKERRKEVPVFGGVPYPCYTAKRPDSYPGRGQGLSGNFSLVSIPCILGKKIGFLSPGANILRRVLYTVQ
jgi:hypothetical protein